MKLFMLLFGHALGDFALQNQFVADFKSSKCGQNFWPWVLLAHALIHGGIVAIITGNVWLGVAETVAHAIIDHGKCNGYYGFHTDQLLHYICKLIWFTIS